MKVHRRGDQRIDGGTTVQGSVDTSTVLIEGLPAAVAGDLSSHNMLGAIITSSPGTVLVKGIPIAVALMDNAAPDSIGIQLHPEGLPTPGTGASTVQVYGGGGTFGGGLGSFGLDGIPGLGNIMQMGSQIIGQVSRTVGTGGQGGMLLMKNMNPNNATPGVGDTVVSANTGQTFTFSSYYTS